MAGTSINGEVHDWADLKIRIAGVEFKGISSISWSAKKEKTLQHGQSSAPIGAGYGNRTYETSFKMTHRDAARFESIAHAAGKDALDYAPFVIIVTYRDKVDNGGLIDWTPEQVVTLNHVDITDVSRPHEQGSQKLEVEYTAICDQPIYTPVVA